MVVGQMAGPPEGHKAKMSRVWNAQGCYPSPGQVTCFMPKPASWDNNTPQPKTLGHQMIQPGQTDGVTCCTEGQLSDSPFPRWASTALGEFISQGLNSVVRWATHPGVGVFRGPGASACLVFSLASGKCCYMEWCNSVFGQECSWPLLSWGHRQSPEKI